MHKRIAMALFCGISAAAEWVGSSGLAADAPGTGSSAFYDYARHFREPIEWPLTGDLKKGRDSGKPSISAVTKDEHDSSPALRLDTSSGPVTLNFVVPNKLFEGLKRFYDEMETALLRPEAHHSWTWSGIWHDIYPPELVAKVMGFLQRAERKRTIRWQGLPAGSRWEPYVFSEESIRGLEDKMLPPGLVLSADERGQLAAEAPPGSLVVWRQLP
ncbi:MAG: hypothetical protein JXR37_23375 [Kiritimatiellae bacterium]|nr:hypothetical protein [Kiritimatiellia bacterium]